MPVSFPITIDGSTTTVEPNEYDITTRRGKGARITTTEYDDTLITIANALNYLYINGGGGGGVLAYVELIEPNSVILSTSECSNTLINNYGQSANIIYTLPIPEANLSFYLFISTEGFEITLDDGDNSVTLDNLEQYDLFKIYTVKTGITEYSWIIEKTAG